MLRRTLLTSIIVATSALLISGCGGGSTASDGGVVLRVTERDFRISAPSEVAAGEVTLRVANQGPDAGAASLTPVPAPEDEHPQVPVAGAAQSPHARRARR